MRPWKRFLRLLSLVILSVAGTTALMYAAPGYFSDARELDSVHSSIARGELESMRSHQASLASLIVSELHGVLTGNLGQSRQYGIPVISLVKERARQSGALLAGGVLGGWCLALLFALPLSSARGAGTVAAFLSAPLLAVPVGVLATVCLVSNLGGPASVLAIIVGVRDFRLLHRLLRAARQAPHMLYARAQGLSSPQLLLVHIVASCKRELLSMLVLSFTLALSALVPVEVVFDRAGLGQLAWSAAMNRDLPVLVAVTVIMATCIGLAGAIAEPMQAMENSHCA